MSKDHEYAVRNSTAQETLVIQSYIEIKDMLRQLVYTLVQKQNQLIGGLCKNTVQHSRSSARLRQIAKFVVFGLASLYKSDKYLSGRRYFDQKITVEGKRSISLQALCRFHDKNIKKSSAIYLIGRSKKSQYIIVKKG